MEHRPNFITTCFYFSLILTLPYFSRGGPRSEEALDSEIYEIDYKGPETHSSVPPPDNSHGKPHLKSSVAMESTGSGSAIMEEKVKKVHG